MNIDPQPLEAELRVESLKRQLSLLSREELEEYTGRLLSVTSKLTHQTKQLLKLVIEKEKG
jgi:hypothetical protein